MSTTHKSFAMLTAADVMSRDVMMIPQQMDLHEAAHLLSQLHVSGAPVIDDNGVCIGVLSATDFVHWAEGQSPQPEPAGNVEKVCADWQIVESDSPPADSVAGYMTPNTVTAGEHASLAALAGKMIDAHVHRIIIVNEHNQPVGVVSTMDILAALAQGE